MLREKAEKKRLMEEELERVKIEKLQHYEDLLKESKNSKDFGAVLDQYQQASKRVEAELEKERIKQEAELEKALKLKRGQRKAQLDKDKSEQLKDINKHYEEETEKQRKEAQELRNMLALEEGKGLGCALEKNLDKIRQQASHEGEATV